MSEIGFKNFRRFRNLETIQLGNISFLVGKNNAGKSTVVKALLIPEQSGKYKIMVKVVDILGIDTSKIIEVEVK